MELKTILKIFIFYFFVEGRHWGNHKPFKGNTVLDRYILKILRYPLFTVVDARTRRFLGKFRTKNVASLENFRELDTFW